MASTQPFITAPVRLILSDGVAGMMPTEPSKMDPVQVAEWCIAFTRQNAPALAPKVEPAPAVTEAHAVARAAELFRDPPPQYQAHVTLVAGGFWVSTGDPREPQSRLFACADFEEMVSVLRERFG